MRLGLLKRQPTGGAHDGEDLARPRETVDLIQQAHLIEVVGDVFKVQDVV